MPKTPFPNQGKGSLGLWQNKIRRQTAGSGCPEAATGWRLHDKDIAWVDLILIIPGMGGLRAIGPLDPFLADLTRGAAIGAEWCNAAMRTKRRHCHLLQKTHPAGDAVAA